MCSIATVLLLALLGIGTTTVVTVGDGESSPVPDVAECRPTLPYGMRPPSEDPARGHHGNGRLYVALRPDGVMLADLRFIGPDGSIGMKVPWWRAPGVGQAGHRVITGHEFSTGATITSSIPDGYGQRFQATGIIFPTEGCYELTGRSGSDSLIFVVEVVKAADTASPAL